MADRPLFIRLSMPSGLEDALEGLAREILRSQPKDLYEFSAQYFEGLLRKRHKGKVECVFLKKIINYLCH
jgi:hypothetical protein